MHVVKKLTPILIVFIIISLFFFFIRSSKSPHHQIRTVSDIPDLRVQATNEDYLLKELEGIGFWESTLDLSSVEYAKANKYLPKSIIPSNLTIHLTNKEQTLGQFIKSDTNNKNIIVESFGISFDQPSQTLHIYLYMDQDLINSLTPSNIELRYSATLLSSLFQLTHPKLTAAEYQIQVLTFRKHILNVPGKSFFRLNDK